jgi:recombinational DNA repair protein (RecF pathway)
MEDHDLSQSAKIVAVGSGPGGEVSIVAPEGKKTMKPLGGGLFLLVLVASWDIELPEVPGNFHAVVRMCSLSW